MTCWNVLGMTPDADSRTIKRQYAVLLKKTRPDDDPQGFQRLREAYEAALAWSPDEQVAGDVLIETCDQTLAQHYQAAMTDGTALLLEVHLLPRHPPLRRPAELLQPAGP